MKQRKLGSSGLVVSAIGLGMGGATTNFGERDDEVQIATMQRALHLGVDFFDTSDAYQNPFFCHSNKGISNVVPQYLD